MRIAIVCDNTTQYGDANLSICYNLAQAFQTCGHEVCILGHCVNADDPLEEVVEGIQNYRFYYPINRINKEIFSVYDKDHSLLRLAIDLLRHPVTACVVLARVLAGYFPIEREYVRLIKKLHTKKPLDVVIACGGAFQPVHALARCDIDSVRIGYLLDPHWKHRNALWYYKREEFYAWRKLDRIVVPKLLEACYDDPELAPYRHKLVAAEFPGIAQHFPVETEIRLDAGKTNLLFAGNFYENIRSPEYLLALLDAMDDHICLNILGGIYGNFSMETVAHMQRLTDKGKLRVHGVVPAPQARTVMQHADVLINIGNTIDNMLPSKIFEYFSTGKPVVHIQKLTDCPCAAYMEKYENALILSESEPVSVSAGKMMAFLGAGLRTLPFETVQARFRECTIPYVAELFLK